MQGIAARWLFSPAQPCKIHIAAGILQLELLPWDSDQIKTGFAEHRRSGPEPWAAWWAQVNGARDNSQSSASLIWAAANMTESEKWQHKEMRCFLWGFLFETKRGFLDSLHGDHFTFHFSQMITSAGGLLLWVHHFSNMWSILRTA